MQWRWHSIVVAVVVGAGLWGLDRAARAESASAGVGTGEDAQIRFANVGSGCDWLWNRLRKWFNGDDDDEDSASDDEDEPTHDGDDGDDQCRETSDIDCEVFAAMVAGGVTHDQVLVEVMEADPEFADAVLGWVRIEKEEPAKTRSAGIRGRGETGAEGADRRVGTSGSGNGLQK